MPCVKKLPLRLELDVLRAVEEKRKRKTPVNAKVDSYVVF